MYSLDRSNGGALVDILRRCADTTILVAGDVMLDEYLGGSVERVSPEAPVPIVRAAAQEFRLGGAANVARQLAALGARVILVGLIGNDSAGETVRALCGQAGIATDCLVSAKDRQTTRKLRILSQSQQLLRIDWENCSAPSTALSTALAERIHATPNCDAIILSDYAKGVMSESIIGAAVQRRNSGAKALIVDPKGRDFSRYRGASLITPNLRELSEACGVPLSTTDLSAITKAARQQIERGSFEGLVVTLGEQGMLMVVANGADSLIPALKRTVYDVTGAGDTAVAVLTACLATGASVAEASQIANIAAGISVGDVGAVAVPSSSIADALIGRPQNKLLARDQLSTRVEQWREQGSRIVFTNGCFDLLHPGHLSLLNYAKSLGDVMVLAINSDAAVRRLKGPSRPLVSENDRAAMLGALSCVDAIAIFDEDTPLVLLRCRPPAHLGERHGLSPG